MTFDQTSVRVTLRLTDEQIEEVLDALPSGDLYRYIEFKYLKARGGLPRQEGRLQSATVSATEPTGWHFADDGTIVIPAGACSHCGHGPDEQGEAHYFGCPASGEDYAAWEREHERYANEGDVPYEAEETP